MALCEMKYWFWIPLTLLAAVPGYGQSTLRLNVQGALSSAWWQIDPNFGHLWATTCPDDPLWSAGEGRSPGAPAEAGDRHVSSGRKANPRDIPMYPRRKLSPVCRNAVRGGIVVEDTITWAGARGEVVVLPDSLETGLDIRTAFARRAVFETGKFREIRFVLDSLGSLQTGDTIRATAHGTLQLHGVHRVIAAPVKAWREPIGLRVQTHFSFPADDLEKVFQMSRAALAMGTALGRWDSVHMGVDLILRR